MAALEGLLVHRDEINRELRMHREMLKEILEIQKKGFHRMEEGLDRTCHHLQMYLTGSAANDLSEPNAIDVEEVAGIDNLSRKNILRKLFS